MKWFEYSIPELDESCVPFIAEEASIAPFSEWDLCERKLVEGWDKASWVRTTNPDDNVPPEDVLKTVLGIPIFSSRLQQQASKLGINNIQYLPINVYRSSGACLSGYAVANILTAVGALDFEHSRISRFPAGWVDPSQVGQVSGIRKAVLRGLVLQVLNDVDIFRLEEFPLQIYVSDRFRSMCVDHAISGIDFRPIRVV